METADLNRIERLLQRERARTLRLLDQLRSQDEAASWMAEGDLSAFPIHPADQGMEAVTREQSLAIAGQESRYFDRIERSLQRLYQSPQTFGECQACGRAISFQRLEVVPHTRYCLDCKAHIGDAA